MNSLRIGWMDFVLPLFVLVVAILLWQTIVWLGDFPVYVLPGPWEVAKAAYTNRAALFRYTVQTGLLSLSGFLLSVLIGVVVGVMFSQSSWIRKSGYPFAIFFQTVPVVAVAPLVIAVFDYGIVSVIVVATIISLFPIITSTTTGLITVDPGLKDLFRLHRASRWQILWKLQLPGAVRYFLTGMKTSSGLAVVGAIVGEFFAGHSSGSQGLGYYILVCKSQLKMPELFAATICCTLLGILVFVTIQVFGRIFLSRWDWEQH